MRSATDVLPIVCLDDDTVMGIMNGNAGLDNGRCGYFYLERA
jgi:hypothetical protein